MRISSVTDFDNDSSGRAVCLDAEEVNEALMLYAEMKASEQIGLPVGVSAPRMNVDTEWSRKVNGNAYATAKDCYFSLFAIPAIRKIPEMNKYLMVWFPNGSTFTVAISHIAHLRADALVREKLMGKPDPIDVNGVEMNQSRAYQHYYQISFAKGLENTELLMKWIVEKLEYVKIAYNGVYSGAAGLITREDFRYMSGEWRKAKKEIVNAEA